jgi:transposase
MTAQVRMMVSDEAWQEMAAVLERAQHQAGRPPPCDRMISESVWDGARTGPPCCELPQAFGTWDAV